MMVVDDMRSSHSLTSEWFFPLLGQMLSARSIAAVENVTGLLIGRVV